VVSLLRRVLLVALLAASVVSCAVPTDPCPLPPEQHPEAWTARPVLTPAGDLVAWTYICTGPDVVAR
jgi:hypothetical protein